MALEIKLGNRYLTSDLEREGYRVANIYVFKDPLIIEKYGRIGIQYRKGTENLLLFYDCKYTKLAQQLSRDLKPLKLVAHFNREKMKRVRLVR